MAKAIVRPRARAEDAASSPIVEPAGTKARSATVSHNEQMSAWLDEALLLEALASAVACLYEDNDGGLIVNAWKKSKRGSLAPAISRELSVRLSQLFDEMFDEIASARPSLN